MSRQRGWVSVSVQTYQSHRTSAQRITNREYTVDETGATLAANSRDAPEEEPEAWDDEAEEAERDGWDDSLVLRPASAPTCTYRSAR